MKIGYARVSTEDQNIDLQMDALHDAGCQKIYTDKISGSIKDRPELDKLKSILRRGDTLVIWKLDRLSRSLKDLMEWIDFLDKEGIQLMSIQDAIDTSSSMDERMIYALRNECLNGIQMSEPRSGRAA